MINIVFPVIELIDRLAIAEIKFERIGSNHDELTWYQDQVKQFDLSSIKDEFAELKLIHNTIWNLESLLKSNQEDKLSLEEIGRRAIEIRNWNNKRVALKNIIAEKLGCIIRETKHNHLSE